MKVRSTAAVLAASAMLLAACGDQETSEPTSQPTAAVGSTSGGSGTDNVNTPEIPNPVHDLGTYKQDPCAMLTPEQASRIGFPRSEQDPEDTSGASCDWRGHRGSRASITLQSGTQWALAGYYQVHAEDPKAYAYFKPVVIAGYPAVFATDFDDRDSGSCAMTVALTDRDVLRMSNALFLGTAQRDDPCAQLKQTAELAVKTISAGK